MSQQSSEDDTIMAGMHPSDDGSIISTMFDDDTLPQISFDTFTQLCNNGDNASRSQSSSQSSTERKNNSGAVDDDEWLNDNSVIIGLPPLLPLTMTPHLTTHITQTITVTNTQTRIQTQSIPTAVKRNRDEMEKDISTINRNPNIDTTTTAAAVNQENKSSFKNAGFKYRKSKGLPEKKRQKIKNGKDDNDNSASAFQCPPGCEALFEDDGSLVSELGGLDQKLVQSISYEIIDSSPTITWDDIAGLDFQKKQIQEIVVWPLIRPEVFVGLRKPPKGVLLFGPPGTGKTMIAKAIASQADTKFFSVSASSLTSKWFGQGEKLVKTLFHVAKFLAPAIIFIDEIDSLLSQRSSQEFEASRRIKTEFLIQLDGARSEDNESRLLIIGATNRPHEIDEAARRRLVRRLYIPLPNAIGRTQLLKNLMSEEKHSISDDNFDEICKLTDGYSGADISALATEAAFGPIRSVKDIKNLNKEKVRPMNMSDFQNALRQVRASVSQEDLATYMNWNKMYGSLG